MEPGEWLVLKELFLKRKVHTYSYFSFDLLDELPLLRPEGLEGAAVLPLLPADASLVSILVSHSNALCQCCFLESIRIQACEWLGLC